MTGARCCFRCWRSKTDKSLPCRRLLSRDALSPSFPASRVPPWSSSLASKSFPPGTPQNPGCSYETGPPGKCQVSPAAVSEAPNPQCEISSFGETRCQREAAAWEPRGRWQDRARRLRGHRGSRRRGGLPGEAGGPSGCPVLSGRQNSRRNHLQLCLSQAFWGKNTPFI